MPNYSTEMNHLEVFFQEPNNFDDNQDVFSTLFLLRRDTLTCFGINPNNYDRIEYQAIFPGTMAILAGIDLLAKFYYTDNEISGNFSSDRFKKFVLQYIDNKNQEVIYQLRNSLLHSFGLYSKDKKENEYNFILDRGKSELINQIDTKNFVISVDLLRAKFENSIALYKADLVNNLKLKTNFELMIPKYGYIGIKK